MEAKIICYEVGEKFPIPNPIPHFDNVRAELTTSFFNIIQNLSKPTIREINAWNTMKFSYGVFAQSDIPFFLVDFGGWRFDISINILKIHKDHLKDWFDNEADFMGMYLVDADSNVLKAMRHIHFTSTDKIKGILRRQALRYKNADEVDEMIRRIVAKNSTVQMIKNTKMTKL